MVAGHCPQVREGEEKESLWAAWRIRRCLSSPPLLLAAVREGTRQALQAIKDQGFQLVVTHLSKNSVAIQVGAPAICCPVFCALRGLTTGACAGD
jgi:hypothetical protein